MLTVTQREVIVETLQQILRTSQDSSDADRRIVEELRVADYIVGFQKPEVTFGVKRSVTVLVIDEMNHPIIITAEVDRCDCGAPFDRCICADLDFEALGDDERYEDNGYTISLK